MIRYATREGAEAEARNRTKALRRAHAVYKHPLHRGYLVRRWMGKKKRGYQKISVYQWVEVAEKVVETFRRN